MAYYESFPTVAAAAELIAPLYPGATYDKDCSAAKSLEAKGKPKWRQVWCFIANEPYAKVRDAFDLELRSTSKRGVQVDLTERELDPPVMQIQYWLTENRRRRRNPTLATTTPAEPSANAAVPATAPATDPRQHKQTS